MKNYIGIYGLGVMGQSLALNIAGHGYSVAVYNIDLNVTKAFIQNKIKSADISPCFTLSDFLAALAKPRKIILMVTAGSAVDEVIESLRPLLDDEDMIIDCGNSYYKDTQRREKRLLEDNLYFFGAGISGGEKGALTGPSIMPGGNPGKYREYLNGLFNVIAAKSDSGESCCSYIGPDGAGHFVKMVHNGIEYADIQVICEAYQLMKDKGMTNVEMAAVFAEWNNGRLKSYLIDITSKILLKKDEYSTNYLVDMILDRAGQKGTGKWTSIEGLDMGVAIPTIAEAVYARCLSAIKEERCAAAKLYQLENEHKPADGFIADLEQAVYASKVMAYAQGFALMQKASADYDWDLPLGKIAMLWREGCIIRARFLEKISEAFEIAPDTKNLMMVSTFAQDLLNDLPAWRRSVGQAIMSGTSIPAISASLQYFEGYTSAALPMNLLQAQRDWFGAHTYQRIDRSETEHFHTVWED